jgi:response regulator of citrate/malate metabolism
MGILTDILKELPLSAVLRERLQELEKRYDRLEEENRKLKDENCELKKKLHDVTGVDKLDEIEEKILVFLSSSNQELTAQMIASDLGLNLTRVEYYLRKMWEAKLVFSNDYSTGRPSEYYLAQKGREYLVKNNLLGE